MLSRILFAGLSALVVVVQSQDYVNCGALSGCSESVFIARNQCYCGPDADALSSCILKKYPNFPFSESVRCPDMKLDSIGYQRCVAERIDAIQPEAMAALNGCINAIQPKVRATIPDELIDGVVLERLSSSISSSSSSAASQSSASASMSVSPLASRSSLASPTLSVVPFPTSMPSASI